MARADAVGSDDDEDNEKKTGTKPAKNISDAMPLASFAGKSIVEVNNPNLGGPSDDELIQREKKFKKMRELYRKK